MLLSARILARVADVNTWEVVPQAQWTLGDSTTVFFQLVDLSADRLEQGFSPPGRRYIPAAGSTLSVSIPSIDASKSLTKTCSQPYSTDGSIWQFSIIATDLVVGTRDLLLTLVESGLTRNGRAKAAISVTGTSESF